jgi:hypothetical protein
MSHTTSETEAVDLRRFNIRVERIEQLDDHDQACQLFEHEADENGTYPEVEAQAYYTAYRTALSTSISGCLDCVRRMIGRDANSDRLTVIEMGH